MIGKMKADEARAWDHSDLAGVLWEHGLRATRAIAWARIQLWESYATLTVKPITSPHGLIRWEIQAPDSTPLAETEPANKGALHRILSDAGYKPHSTLANTWVK